MIEVDLKSKVALVTGGAQRAGRLFSLALARCGADVVVNHYQTGKEARKTKEMIEAMGRRCLTIEADISNVGQGRRMIEEIEAEFGRMDILLHNASNFNQCDFEQVTEAIWESSFGVNLKGPFFLSQAAAGLMRKNGGGRIIALAGNSYHENWPDFIPHVLAKTALAKLMQSLAATLTPDIQCNVICPDAFYPAEIVKHTEGETILHKDQPEKFHKEYINRKGRSIYMGIADNVAEMIVYLAGCSDYLNGAIITLDGGKAVV